MKKLIGSLTFFGLIGLMLVGQPKKADAQAMKNWTWDRYNLSFKLPYRMRVTRNNRRGFIAKMSGLILKIKPWKSRRSTARSSAMYGYGSYRIVRRKRIRKKRYIRGRSGFQRYLILGDGYVGRSPAYFAVIGLASKNSSNNFYVRMWWKKYNHRWVKRYIVKIALSFRSSLGGRRLPPSGGGYVPPSRGYVPMKNWIWKRYRLKFGLPSRMRPSRSTKYQFIAKMRGLVLKIKPWKSRRSTARSAAMYGYSSYRIVRRKRITRRKYIRGRRGLNRYVIVGDGFVNGRSARFAVIGLTSKRSVDNFYIRMWWHSYNNAYMKKYIGKIARSFRSY